MSKVVKLSEAFFVPARSRVQSVARIGSRVMMGEQCIKCESKTWHNMPKKIVLKPRKRAFSISR